MRVLLAKCKTRDEFLELYLSDLDCGGIFLPTRSVLLPATRVLVDMRMPEIRDHLLIRGQVIWQRKARRRDGIRAGLGIEFLPGEGPKVEYVLALARGELQARSARRKHRRLPTDLPVAWRLPDHPTRTIDRLTDISTGGAFISATTSPDVGALVVLELLAPGKQAPDVIEGRIAWRASSGPKCGFGVEFRWRDVVGRRRLRELTRRIEAAVTS